MVWEEGLIFNFRSYSKPMRILLFIITAALLQTACNAPRNDDKQNTSGIVTDAVQTRIDSALKRMVDAGEIAGVSALIVERDKEVYFNAFGYADKEKKTPFDRNTLVRIYSMTKPVTGVALMQLYEKGAFQLDDPLSKYAPEFSDMKVFKGVDARGQLMLEPAKRPITIRDLTRHTAGFAREEHPQLGELVSKANVRRKENTLREMAAGLSKLPLDFHPGEEWSYGISVDVQAYLVELLSGESFDTYIKKNILDPLKMNSTWYVPADTGDLAAMYQKEEGGLARIVDKDRLSFNWQEWPMKPGGFGLVSSIDDYQRFARMLVNEGTFDGVSILKPETVKLMATNHLSDSVKERMWLPTKGQVGFGIDFAVRVRPPADEKENNGTVGEFFWDGAASTLFWVDPQNELTAVLFVQVLPFSNTLHKNFRDAIYGRPNP